MASSRWRQRQTQDQACDGPPLDEVVGRHLTSRGYSVGSQPGDRLVDPRSALAFVDVWANESTEGVPDHRYDVVRDEAADDRHRVVRIRPE